jgi:hypothetical protein
MDVIGKSIKGIFRDRLIGPDGSLLYDSGWAPNTIVDNCRILLAGLMRNELSGGIHHLAVGQGDVEWDTEGVQAPDRTVEALATPYPDHILVDSTADTNLVLEYLSVADKVVQPGPTSRLQITATLAPGYPAPELPLSTYPLREFGLFGGAGGTYMINCVRHPVIHKHASATLIRVIRLYF